MIEFNICRWGFYLILNLKNTSIYFEIDVKNKPSLSPVIHKCAKVFGWLWFLVHIYPNKG